MRITRTNEIQQRVKDAVCSLEHGADVILYGSRSRGTAGPDSDWDFLVLVEGPAGEAREDAIRHRIYEIEWDTGEVLSTIVCDRKTWHSPRYLAMPIRQAVERDGVLL